ncbi:MAG: hypothetical protein MI725_02835 [Pirellulales bacterium]|nr:hypothetical protein [Pirellulales bacterium]
MNRFIFFQLMLTFFLCPLATSQAQAHSDVLLVDVGGQVAIGAAEDIGGAGESFDLDTHAFESILIPGSIPPTPADYEATEPGFFGLHGVNDAGTLATLGASALPGTASVSASLTNFSIDGASANLFFWNGTGSVDFDPAPAGTSFNFDPSANLATTGSNGDLDDHPIFELNATSGVPADGAYLISPAVDVAGLATSEPFFLILLADSLITGEVDAGLVEEALEDLEAGITTDAVVDFGGSNVKDFAFFEEAVEFVENTLVVPEPSTTLLSLMAIGFVAIGRIRSIG